jgi:hypothetical protein
LIRILSIIYFVPPANFREGYLPIDDSLFPESLPYVMQKFSFCSKFLRATFVRCKPPLSQRELAPARTAETLTATTDISGAGPDNPDMSRTGCRKCESACNWLCRQF